jgi:hypothetical protein
VPLPAVGVLRCLRESCDWHTFPRPEIIIQPFQKKPTTP